LTANRGRFDERVLKREDIARGVEDATNGIAAV
jgi:hypothetical protein